MNKSPTIKNEIIPYKKVAIHVPFASKVRKYIHPLLTSPILKDENRGGVFSPPPHLSHFLAFRVILFSRPKRIAKTGARLF